MLMLWNQQRTFMTNESIKQIDIGEERDAKNGTYDHIEVHECLEEPSDVKYSLIKGPSITIISKATELNITKRVMTTCGFDERMTMTCVGVCDNRDEAKPWRAYRPGFADIYLRAEHVSNPDWIVELDLWYLTYTGERSTFISDCGRIRGSRLTDEERFGEFNLDELIDKVVQVKVKTSLDRNEMKLSVKAEIRKLRGKQNN
jgi:hypothetical protein